MVEGGPTPARGRSVWLSTTEDDVFSLDESAREEEFEDMRGFVDLRPIPAVILNVYRRIFK